MREESISETYHGPLGLDELPKELKALNMGICFIVVTAIAFSNYSRNVNTLDQIPLCSFLNWLAWISPTCIAVAWLRLTGVSWRRALLFFIFVPVVLMGILFIFYLLALVFMDWG